MPEISGIQIYSGTYSDSPSAQMIASDIVINELMVDPYPVVALPEQEYIELFNRTTLDVNIKGWKLSINGVEKILGEATITGKGFLMLCSTGAAAQLSPFGSVLPVPAFQGLLNKGASVVLLNDRGIVIDQISYTEDWYRDQAKKNGGWSLERIDPDRNCGQPMNWKASAGPVGGTPGKMNSVFSVNPDNQSPVLRWAAPLSNTEIEIAFSESMDSLKILINQNYTISDQIGNPDRIIIVTPDVVRLVFNKPLLEGKEYRLELKNLPDECGNLLKTSPLPIQWAVPKSGDLVINELLFNPYPGGADFVEVYNNSSRWISINRLFLGTRDGTGVLKQIYQVATEKFMFGPGGFLVCTTDSAAVLKFYFSACPECFVAMASMPGFNNDKGTVVLLDESMKLLDEFSYAEDMHNPALYDVEGVSLERVNPGAPTDQPGNWQSAAASAGYATPGYKNSQAKNDEFHIKEITIDPETFSPNHDGYNDELIINYQFRRAGLVCNCRIFDSRGRFIVDLRKNEILGTSGNFSWNGEDETGKRQPPGIYIVLLKVFDPSGYTKTFKKAAILTDRYE